MLEAAKSNLFLYVDDSCLMYQYRDVKEFENQLIMKFENVCGWSLENKLSIYFGKDKTELIIFLRKRKIKSQGKLNVKYKKK